MSQVEDGPLQNGKGQQGVRESERDKHKKLFFWGCIFSPTMDKTVEMGRKWFEGAGMT